MLAHTDVCRPSGGICQSSLKSRMTFILSLKLEISCCDISKLHDVDHSQKTDLDGKILLKAMREKCLYKQNVGLLVDKPRY